LGELVVIPEYTNSYVKDATIRRFKICIDLFRITLKQICVAEGFSVTSPKSTLEKAFENKLLKDSPIWLSMLEDRNMTSHTYKRLIANEIYYKIDSYYMHMKDAYSKIKARYSI
jgi:nucleotidyltransferase substrate binding protein (TIGR01987 family)